MDIWYNFISTADQEMQYSLLLLEEFRLLIIVWLFLMMVDDLKIFLDLTVNGGYLTHHSSKVGCIFPMVISSEFRMGQYRDVDHQENAPQFIKYYLTNTNTLSKTSFWLESTTPMTNTNYYSYCRYKDLPRKRHLAKQFLQIVVGNIKLTL